MVDEEPDRVAMLSDLRAFEERLSERLSERLEERFSERLEERLFERLSERLSKQLSEQLGEQLGQRIASESETIRRHFDIMVERVETAVKLVAEVNAHHAVISTTTSPA